jgi:hypothetical protein
MAQAERHDLPRCDRRVLPRRPDNKFLYWFARRHVHPIPVLILPVLIFCAGIPRGFSADLFYAEHRVLSTTPTGGGFETTVEVTIHNDSETELTGVTLNPVDPTNQITEAKPLIIGTLRAHGFAVIRWTLTFSMPPKGIFKMAPLLLEGRGSDFFGHAVPFSVESTFFGE